MLIGELAKLSGFSRDTIRFYEKQGLIEVGRKDRRLNNYKEYSEDMLKRLLVIKRLKGFGFTLHETAEFISLIEEDTASCANVSEKMSEKVILIDKKIEELKEIKQLLLTGVADCLNCYQLSDKDENCPMLTSGIYSN
jgi:DNA-binding transcriptional MerR regulator